MINTLKPCVIFDLDDTLFDTPDIDWGAPKGDWYKAIVNAPHIGPTAFLYHSIDYMISDPPDWAESDPDWPKEIFFCTARPDYYRQPTLEALCLLTKEKASYLNKRLIMRPFNSDSDLSHTEINTPKESKAWTLQQVVNKGFRPVLAFDNSSQAVSVYIEGGVEVINHTIAVREDKEKALRRYKA